MDRNNMRGRDTNFDRYETEKLVYLLKKYDIIMSKKTDHASVKQKNVAWQNLAADFNQGATHYRSKKQLIYKFNNMRRRSRLKMDKIKQEIRNNAVGPPTLTSSSPIRSSCDSAGDYSLSGKPSYENDTTSELQPENKEQASNTNEYTDDEKMKTNEDNDFQLQWVPPPLVNIETMENSPQLAVNKNTQNEETKRKIIALIQKKQELVEIKIHRECILSKYAEEEQQDNLKQKRMLFELELEYKKRLYDLSIQKAAVELDIAKEQLKAVTKYFLVSFFHSNESSYVNSGPRSLPHMSGKRHNGNGHNGNHSGHHGGNHGNHGNHSGNHGNHSGHSGHNGARLSPPAQGAPNQHTPNGQHDDIINYIYDSWNRVTRELERGSDDAKYYQEVVTPRHLANFRPFNLDEWWGRRLIQTINRNKHRS